VNNAKKDWNAKARNKRKLGISERDMENEKG
jgi:hypothetical protein